jgi:glycosyltransferase involved in cell wall biosynthesis
LKIAFVHDWFLEYLGSEKCVESFVNIWKDADIFSLVDFLSDEDRNVILKGKKAETSFVQKLPFSRTNHRVYLSLFPLAIEQLDLSEYDLILSSSHAFAKGVITNVNQLHICYCHTPIRYAWDLYHQYLKESNMQRGIKGTIARSILHKIRMWDFTTANRADYFIANSHHIARRIKKIYGRESVVIYPPVDIEKFAFCNDNRDYYLIASRFVPYKKVDLVVEAFSKMPDKKLIVIGNGTDSKRINTLATSNIKIIDFQPVESLVEYMQHAKAFIFAAEEDFGITIVEAQACGTPIIAYRVGGASETVIDGKTGLLYDKQNTASLISAIQKFESQNDFDLQAISNHAQSFSRYNFEKNIKHFVSQKYNSFFNL